jgi:predicted transport protein
MAIFQIDNDKLAPISEMKFDLERDIQSLTEKNLEAVFGLKFVTTEFQLNNLRIDTLAFDPEAQSFVIIEYKRDRSFSVIDQGYAYLSLMLNNKADFILEYNEEQHSLIDRKSIDWSQSRVIFIANSFTTYQQQATNFKDLPIELWEAKRYSNKTVLYNKLKSPDSSESIKSVSKNTQIQTVSKEVKKYQISDVLKRGDDSVQPLFNDLRDKILNLDNRIEESPQNNYIGYKISWKILVAIKVQKSRLLLEITRTAPKQLKDPAKKSYLVKDSMKHYNQNISRVEINDSDDVDYAFGLVRQAYERQYK